MSKTILFGLTGGIGSGKTIISNGLREMGYPVYDTDTEARRIMRDNPCVRSQIELQFGSDIFQNNELDRKAIASQVFGHPELLERLNKAVHPAVAFDLKEWVKRMDEHSGTEEEGKICFVESAILFESGMDSLCAAVVCISAPEEIRIARILQRDHTTTQETKARIDSQLNDQERGRRSQLIITNDGEEEIATLCLRIQNFCRNFAKQTH